MRRDPVSRTFRVSPGDRIAVGVALVSIVLLFGVLVAVRLAPRPPVVEAAAQLAAMPGVTYRGEVVDPSGPRTSVSVTVDRSGRAYGVLERASGARAQVAVDGSRAAINGNAAWWRSESLPASLSGIWIAGLTDVPGRLLDDGRLTPSSLARELTATEAGPWIPDQSTTVAGRSGRVFGGELDRVAVVGSDDGSLLSTTLPLDVPAVPDTDDVLDGEPVATVTLAVVAPTASELSRAGGLAGRALASAAG